MTWSKSSSVLFRQLRHPHGEGQQFAVREPAFILTCAFSRHHRMLTRATGWSNLVKNEITSWFTHVDPSGQTISKELFELIKSIGESKSKQEEDLIIVREIKLLKTQVGTAESMKRLRDVLDLLFHSCQFFFFFWSVHAVWLSFCSAFNSRQVLIRIIYCEMLGHDAGFGYIHAINATQQPSIIEKV